MKIIQLHKKQEQLIARAIKNNRQAQHELYQTYAPKMLGVCRMYVRDLHHAEEIMLDGFYKVFTKLSGFKHQGSFEGWIRRIMVRECIDFLRQKNKIVLGSAEPETVADSSEELQTDLDITHIQNAIDTLPEGYKMVFILYSVEGYKHQEIAEMLHITTGTSKSQLSKARKMLQEKLHVLKNTDHGI